MAGGVEHELGVRSVAADDGFVAWRLDLAAWGGQTVELRLHAEVEGSVDFDQLFLGAPTVWGRAPGQVRRVVVIGLDTTRPDHLGFFGYDRPTSPEIDEILRSSTVFDHAWTPAPRTRPSFRAATTGRNPLDAVGAKNLGEVFSDHGFATAGIVANIHLQPRFDFHLGFDEWWFDGRATATQQVDRALAFLDRYPERDTYLFLHFMDPHLLYRPPADTARAFVQSPDPDLPATFTRWDVYQWQRQGILDDRRKQHIIDLYDAELRALSEQLGRLYDRLDRMPGRSVVVLHNDHGEEFWEHDGFEHNHTLYDDVTRAILAFRSGAGQSTGRRIDAPATLTDIAPTLLDLAGIEGPPTDGRSLVPLLLDTTDDDFADRPIGVGHLRYGLERWGVVHRGHKYMVHTSNGYEELYDLATDPAEATNLALDRDLDPWRRALAAAHDMTVGPGWRIRVEIHSADRRPFELKLPAAARQVGIIDPEAMTPNPANQAWGETPRVRPEDIGEVTLSDDRRTLTYTPGSSTIRGILTVLFDEAVPTPDPEGVTLFRSGQGLPLMAARGTAAWRKAGDSLWIEPGTIVIPPPSEAQRILALRGQADDAGADRQALIDLGYLTEDDEDDEDDEVRSDPPAAP